jgi:hypothetical protein
MPMPLLLLLVYRRSESEILSCCHGKSSDLFSLFIFNSYGMILYGGRVKKKLRFSVASEQSPRKQLRPRLQIEL